MCCSSFDLQSYGFCLDFWCIDSQSLEQNNWFWKMSTTAVSNLQIATLRTCKFFFPRGFKDVVTPVLGGNSKAIPWDKLRSVYNMSSLKHFQLNSTTLSSTKFEKIATRAMSGSREDKPVSGLPIDLKAYPFSFLVPSFIGSNFVLSICTCFLVWL